MNETKVILITLSLDNFRGVSATYEFGRKSNKFFGANGAGKTRLLTAETWLRCGQDDKGNTKFPIKTIKDGDIVSGSEHSVTAVYLIRDSYHEFSRTYFEKEKNENATQNTTIYHYNKKKCSKKVYDEKILEVFGDKYRLCNEMKYFSSLKWKDRRDIMFSMIADKIDEDAIIDSFPEFREAAKPNNVHDHYEICVDSHKNAVEKIKKINIQIEERQKMIASSTDGQSIEEAEKAVLFAGNEVDRAKDVIDSFNAGDKTKITNELKIYHSQLFDAENQLNQEKENARAQLNQQNKNINDLKSLIEHKRFEMEDLYDVRERLRKDWVVIKNRTADSHPCDKYNESCPYFGLQVDPGIVEKHVQNLNLKKSKDLEFNVTKGKELTAETLRLENEIIRFEEKLKSLLNQKPPEILTVIETDEIKKLKLKIEESKKQTLSMEVPPAYLEILQIAKQKHEAALQKRAAIGTIDDSQQRINELTEEAKNLTIENLKASEFIDLYNQYTSKLARAVEDPINAMFKETKIKMFERLENGKLNDCCEITDLEGRPYNGSLSVGEKIRIELDYISTFRNHFNINGPVFIDDINLYTGEIPLFHQTIELWAKRGCPLTKEI